MAEVGANFSLDSVATEFFVSVERKQICVVGLDNRSRYKDENGNFHLGEKLAKEGVSIKSSNNTYSYFYFSGEVQS